MAKYPLYCAADAIERALEVANELAILQASETAASHICTLCHIGAIIEVAMIATRELTKELCVLEDKLEAGEEPS